MCQFAGCDVSLEGQHGLKRFCTEAHRKAASRKPTAVAGAVRATRTKAADKLRRELTDLGVIDSYEAEMAIGAAMQLDSGTIVGAAWTSLSKEVDRRVDALRLKATRPDDRVQAATDRFEEKRSHLRSA